jgi:histidine ammonia-lyase
MRADGLLSVVALGSWSIKLEHYLHTLRDKPGALKNAEALRHVSPSFVYLLKSVGVEERRGTPLST